MCQVLLRAEKVVKFQAQASIFLDSILDESKDNHNCFYQIFEDHSEWWALEAIIMNNQNSSTVQPRIKVRGVF